MNGLVGGAFIGFLSTPSARRATIAPPLRRRGVMISIHALREEGDRVAAAQFFFDFLFLSTPSARRATFIIYLRSVLRWISIHALREEGDYLSSSRALLPTNFYPRPPRGGRPFFMMVILALPGISIHALREEGDVKRSGKIDGAILFLSTPSARRATCFQPMPGLLLSNFYPRPPRGGRLTSAFLSRTTSNFYPRPPRGGRRRHDMADIAASGFLSTPSARRATTHPEPSG